MNTKKYKFPGFPGQSNVYIESPNIAELLFMPIFSRCDVDSFRKHATQWQKDLLDQVPFIGGYKYHVIDTYPQFLYPDMCPVGTRSQANLLYEWHCDGFKSVESEPTVFHIFQTDSECGTMFLDEDVELELPENMPISQFNTHVALLGAEQWKDRGVQVKNNRFTTFSNHIHRSVAPRQKQFRYFFRISESNIITPATDREQPRLENGSFIHHDGRTVKVPNINKNPDGTLLLTHYPTFKGPKVTDSAAPESY